MCSPLYYYLLTAEIHYPETRESSLLGKTTLCTVYQNICSQGKSRPVLSEQKHGCPAVPVLPLSWQADEGLFVAPLAKTKELVDNSMCLQEKLFHAGLQ